MDWVRFLEENNVPFVTRGPNTKRGEVSIQCPMCGEDDPSEHLGINLSSEKWGCHRDQSHRGKSARTLIKAILGCSSSQAWLIVKQYSHSDPDTLEAALTVLENDNNGYIQQDNLAEKVKAQQDPEIQFSAFNAIKARGVTKRFFTYLQSRGYDNPYEIIDRYELRCALTGRYKDRIIVPIIFQNQVIGWTGRAIGKSIDAPRYLASSAEIKTMLFNYDGLKAGGERLFIVEGPFDAIKLDNYALTHVDDKYLEKGLVNFRATCMFGTSPTVSQIALLRGLVKRFDEAWVLFDKGADGPANELATWIGAKVAYLPQGVDDPGELTEKRMGELSLKEFNGHFSFGLNWSLTPPLVRKRKK